MQVVEMDIGALKPYEKNPRINDQAVDAVARSLQEFGWQQPIVVDANKVIIIGHTRLKAAKQLGYQKVPCVVAEGLTPEQVRALRIADNKTGEIAEWDFKLLPEELQALCGAGYDATLTGFSLEDIGDILAGEDAPIDGATDPDAVPEPPIATFLSSSSLFMRIIINTTTITSISAPNITAIFTPLLFA